MTGVPSPQKGSRGLGVWKVLFIVIGALLAVGTAVVVQGVMLLWM